jgi:hypothetical protein
MSLGKLGVDSQMINRRVFEIFNTYKHELLRYVEKLSGFGQL